MRPFASAAALAAGLLLAACATTPTSGEGAAVFDPALPRSAFQVLTLVFDYGGNLDPRHPEAT